MPTSRRACAAALAVIARGPSTSYGEALSSRLVDLHADNWEEVLSGHDYVLMHFWAPFDAPSMKFTEVHEVVAATQATDPSGRNLILHGRSDVTDERGFTWYLTEFGITRLPTIVLFRRHSMSADGAGSCDEHGEACERIGAVCSCASVLPHEGRSSNHVPTPNAVEAWLDTQVDVRGRRWFNGAANRNRRLDLFHDGRYDYKPSEPDYQKRDLFDNADAAGSWGMGWLEVGSGAPPPPSGEDAALGRAIQCDPGPTGQCHGCTLGTVAPSGWDNPDTSLGWTGCETCGDQGS